MRLTMESVSDLFRLIFCISAPFCWNGHAFIINYDASLYHPNNNTCTNKNTDTPKTEKFEESEDKGKFPYFLKVSSGTNAGRGVVFVKSQEQLDETIAEFKKAQPDPLLLVQQPILGRIIQGQFCYENGKCLAFFFTEMTEAEDLAGGATKMYLGAFSKSTWAKECSSQKVELDDAQWEAVTHIAVNVGKATKYHGFMDIEFLIPPPEQAQELTAAAYLLECNPRFSGDIHTTLSNPGFLDTYFDILYERVDEDQNPVVYSADTEITTRYKDFNPIKFYTTHPMQILGNRNWKIAAEMTFKGEKVKGAAPVTRPVENAFAGRGSVYKQYN